MFTLLVLATLPAVGGLAAPGLPLRAKFGQAVSALHHLSEAPVLRSQALLDKLSNTQIPASDGRSIQAHVAMPKGGPLRPLPVLILLHEFFGLSESIVSKAQVLADELDCAVVAPDLFRGVTTSFIPRAIWLALTTQQSDVDDDLDAVVRYCAGQELCDTRRLALMGFCWGGGKALRYTTRVRPTAATVVFYGAPLTKPSDFEQLRAPVCAVYGTDDAQFPQRVVDDFRRALEEAEVEHEVVSYYGVGHAFWSDMDAIEKEEMPQIAAYRLATTFLRNFYTGKESFAAKRAFLEFQLAEAEAAERERAAAGEPEPDLEGAELAELDDDDDVDVEEDISPGDA